MLPCMFVTTALAAGRERLIFLLNLFPGTNWPSPHSDSPVCPHRVEALSSLLPQPSFLPNTLLLTPACLEIPGATAWQCMALDKHLVMDSSSSPQTRPITWNRKWIFIKTLHSTKKINLLPVIKMSAQAKQHLWSPWFFKCSNTQLGRPQLFFVKAQLCRNDSNAETTRGDPAG